MGRIIVARHGHTALNANALTNVGECIRGWLDIPLDPQGCEEAIAVADQVRDLYSVRRVYTSDIARARQSAEIIANRLGVGVIPMSGLRTWNTGDAAGKPVAEVLTELADLEAHPERRARGGGSKAEFEGNLQKCLREILHTTRPSKYDSLVLTHGRVIQALPFTLSNSRNPKPYTGLNRTGIVLSLRRYGKGWKITNL